MAYRKGRLEVALLSLAMLDFVVPLVWIASPLLSFADYPLQMAPLIAGVACFVAGLWLFLYSVGQLLVLPNWVAGPSNLATFGMLFALRVDAEERMMLDEFGADYQAYMARTKRLVPRVW